jgi:type I restriction enzyme R subunit
MPELRVLLEGVFEHRRFLDLLRHFVVFEDAGGGATAGKIAFACEHPPRTVSGP